MNIISVQALQKSFGKNEALRDVSFNVDRGEVVGFIGPNGAGKSTTIRILLGIIKRDHGEATIFGKDVWNDSVEIHKKIAYVPGDVTLWGNLTGGEVINLLMNLHGSGNTTKRDTLIERFELDPQKKTKTYSKGNRQKVALISALSVDADLYIFDEPTSGLDPLMEQVFQNEIETLKNAGKSILLSSHILSEVERLSDKIVIIKNGEIVEVGTMENLRHLTRSTITLDCAEDISHFTGFEGVHDFTQNNQETVFSVDHEHLNDILVSISELQLKSLIIAPPSLEDLFMRHYENI